MARVLFRLWVVGTVLWVAFGYFASAGDIRPDARTIFLEAALVPPGLILVIGLMLWWAFNTALRRDLADNWFAARSQFSYVAARQKLTTLEAQVAELQRNSQGPPQQAHWVLQGEGAYIPEY